MHLWSPGQELDIQAIEPLSIQSMMFKMLAQDEIEWLQLVTQFH